MGFSPKSLMCVCCFVFIFMPSCADRNNLHSDSFKGQTQISSEKKRMISIVEIGDDIFSAKQKLIENGFRIKYGPKLSNAQKSKYLMIVDFGVGPGPSDYLEETLGWGGDGESPSGVIYANESGKIFRIK